MTQVNTDIDVEIFKDEAGCSPASNVIFVELINQLKTYVPEPNIELISKAYCFAAKHHSDQFRRSGEPYITHPLEVAVILTSMNMDTASIIAAILHDTVEDTDATFEEIEDLFGKAVRDLVDGLTKIAKIKFRSTQEKMAENFRKMVMAMASDLRVVLIKLADRLHNMRTIGGMPEEKKLRISQETLDIYAPLANRLGIYGIKSELEDLCLKTLKRSIYSDISKKVTGKRSQRTSYIDEVCKIIEDELIKYGFKDPNVYGRPKHFYSIYKKMIDRELDFEDIHDLFAFRILVDSVKDCYEALGVVHAMWKPMPGRFKDYIAMPKANLYQSLHTTVIRPNGEPIEIQIRTIEMHQTCEYGVAAHWSYKEKGSAKNDSESNLDKFSWLRQIMEWQSELTDPDEFLEAVKIDLFEEEIFVFTPKGDVIQLPKNATCLDFAFQVHTEVGLTTVGAKINGRMVPLKKTLVSGDIIGIMTSPHQKPGKDWLNWVITSKARNKIRSTLREEQRDRSRKIGAELLNSELQNHGTTLEKFQKTKNVEKLAKFAKESNIDDVIVGIGYGRLNPKELIEKVFPPKEIPNDGKLKTGKINIEKQAERSRKKSKSGILVDGIENVMVNFAKCCFPLPGETVIGFITRGRGVTIHRAGCSRALDMDPHRRVEVQWSTDSTDKAGAHTAHLRVTAQDRHGVLAEVTSAIAACDANISKASIRVTEDLMGVLDFELAVKGMSQMQAVIQKIESIPNVVKVERVNTKQT
jgi:GTP diphosphokinase / guanosine-3',5'-bis(diphosphate) 3'-diphosphatase